MSRTLTPRARVHLERARTMLASVGVSLDHIVNIANAARIAENNDIKPNDKWHTCKPDLSDLLADAFDYIED